MPVTTGRMRRRGGMDYSLQRRAALLAAASAATAAVSPTANYTDVGYPAVAIVTWVTTAALETVTGVTDTKGNAWTVWQNAATVGAGVAICMTSALAGRLLTTDTVTVQFSAAVTQRTVSLHEYNARSAATVPVFGPVSGTAPSGTTVGVTLGPVSPGVNEATVWLWAGAWVGVTVGTPATNYVERADANGGTLNHYYMTRSTSTGAGQGTIGPTWTGNRLAVCVGLGISQGAVQMAADVRGNQAVTRAGYW